ncbi:MAG: 50S ribosomal protein L18 [Candidatus Anstonellales archaeon]
MSKATGPTYSLKPRRRRECKTDFSRRLALIKAGLPRLVVRKTNRAVIVQVVQSGEKGDSTIASVHSSILSRFGWYPKCNSPTAYLSGLLCARQAKKKGVESFVADFGLHTASKGSILFAAIKGAIEGGLTTKFSKGMIREDALDGSKISSYAKLLKEKSQEAFDKKFSEYIKRKIDPLSLPKIFLEVKEKILSS